MVRNIRKYSVQTPTKTTFQEEMEKCLVLLTVKMVTVFQIMTNIHLGQEIV